jgi:hypothetical protein
MMKMLNNLLKKLLSELNFIAILSVENLALRQQLSVLKQSNKRPQLRIWNRLFWIGRIPVFPVFCEIFLGTCKNINLKKNADILKRKPKVNPNSGRTGSGRTRNWPAYGLFTWFFVGVTASAFNTNIIRSYAVEQ